eukprot:scaffold821_cov122-Cylindrotheca_fusiformis.AAC.6
MGSVFGKVSVAEPHFEVLLERQHHVDTSYEIRKYGRRFAATCSYDDAGDEDSPFKALAGYIGVLGKPQNECEEETIAATAPVVTEHDDGKKVMKFMLLEQYEDMSEIPKPTNPAVHIEEIPPQVGVVHQYHGSLKEKRNKELAKELAEQLMKDGVEGINEDYVMENYQFWGYNPPFTLPVFRRNEVWLQLTEDQVEYLVNNYNKKDPN